MSIIDENKLNYIVNNITSDNPSVKCNVMMYLYGRDDVHINANACFVHNKFVQKLKSVSTIPRIYSGLLFDWILQAIYLDDDEFIEDYLDLTYQHYANLHETEIHNTITTYIPLPWKRCVVCGQASNNAFCPLHTERELSNTLLSKDFVCGICGCECTYIVDAAYLKNKLATTQSECVVEVIPCHEHYFTLRTPLRTFSPERID